MRKFARAQAQNQAAIERHLVANQLESSDEEENEGSEQVLSEAFCKVVSSYQGEGGDVERSITYLSDTFQSGGAICAICISSVKKTDPIWSCSGCFTFMHLPCIQHWITDSLRYKRERAIALLWACPKCRMEYQEDEVPKKYLCFCGKTTNPDYQPWIIPHSCGERCEKELKPKCGHRCLLLCHPGACPPCPKITTMKCFCGKGPAQQRRCNAKEWSCGETCGRNLPRCRHLCQSRCHPGDCPDCSETVRVACHCGNRTEERHCNEAIWNCDRPCGNRLSCNIHVCEENCHRPGDCGECTFAKNRTCPCGKKRYQVSCEQSQVPTCGDTCDKPLDCGSHRCSMRCHTDRCGQCLQVVVKSCRCQSYAKEIACAKEFHCTKKCTRMRLCGKHLCNKKCCDCLLTDSWKVCEKICDATLNCQRHKCLAPCHSGPCYPCPRTNVVQCRCGKSSITVPCGRVKRMKPPRCKRLCKIPPSCHHPKRESHICHYGPCPPCRKICGLLRKQCPHPCPAPCHASASQNQGDRERTRTKIVPCPPCEVSVLVTCLGGHETRPWPCHTSKPSSCQRPCGQLLSCKNHTCEMLCHKVRKSGETDGSDCEQCERACTLPRVTGCSHLCPKICHKAPCDPCNQLVKVSCHCGINSLYRRCAELTSTSAKDRVELLKCGNQCPKNYPCGHRCVENCHPGACPNAEACSKRVKLWCKCKRIKRDVPCVLLRKEEVVVECDITCQTLKEEQERAQEIRRTNKRKEEEARNRIELEKFERKFKPRRRQKVRTDSTDDVCRDGNTFKKISIYLVPLLSMVFIIFYTIYASADAIKK